MNIGLYILFIHVVVLIGSISMVYIVLLIVFLMVVLRFVFIGSVSWLLVLLLMRGYSMDTLDSMPSDKILKSFWSLCAYYKRHVNDGLCDIVFDAICRYSRAYMDRTGCPILVFEECPKLIALLKAEGLQ